MSKPTFYTAFSNDMKNIIPNLSDEAMKISDLLQELAFNDKLYYIKDEIFGIDRLLLNFGKYGRRIDIFYFSGHGVNDCLQLTEHKISHENMSSIVNTSLKNAKLIFFNACATFPLARTIVETRDGNKEPLALIAFRGEISSIIAERFATFFFTQIGQPGTFREAYEQAKMLLKAIHNQLRFAEFETLPSVQSAGEDFDISYIEIKPGNTQGEEKKDPSKDTDPPKSSIIGKDKLLQDALMSNYMHEVVECLVKNAGKIEQPKLDILEEALVTADQIAKGEKKDKQAKELFKKAAEVLPGVVSGKTFDSLINAEKNIDKPQVKNLIGGKQTDPRLAALINRVKSLKF